MNELFMSVLLRSVGTSAAILGLWFLSPVLNRFAQARWRYALWVLVAAGFLLPPTPFESPVALKIAARSDSSIVSPTVSPTASSSIFKEIPTTGSRSGNRSATTNGKFTDVSNRRFAEISRKTNAENVDSPPIFSDSTEAAEKTNDFETESDRAFVPVSIFSLLSVVWLVGLFGTLTVHFFRYRQFCRTAARWGKPIENPAFLALLERIKAETAVSAPIRSLEMGDAITSPMIFGFFRPTLLLPETTVGSESGATVPPKLSDGLALILKHELIHFKRRDLWFRLFVLFASAVHWFNPLSRLASRRVETECEASCDERVVSGESSVVRRVYAEAILDVVRTQVRKATVLTTQFDGGKQEMKRRLQTIFDTKTNRFGGFIFVAFLPFVLFGAVLVDVRADLQDSSENVDSTQTTSTTETTANETSSPETPTTETTATETTANETPTNETAANAAETPPDSNVLFCGKIVDESGSPLSGVSVEFFACRAGRIKGSSQRQKMASVATDVAGDWELAALPAPFAAANDYKFEVVLKKDGFVQVGRVINENFRKAYLWTLDQGKTSGGRVVDSAGRPVPNADVEVFSSRYRRGDPISQFDLKHSVWQNLKTDADGRFQSGVYAEGSTIYAVLTENLVPESKIVTDYLEDLGEITLSEGFRPRVKLLDKSGRPLPRTPIALYTLIDGIPANIRNGRFVETDEEGIAIFGPVKPGKIELHIDPDRFEGDEPLSFRPEIGVFPSRIHLTFVPNQQIEVRAVEGATLTFRSPEPIDFDWEKTRWVLCYSNQTDENIDVGERRGEIRPESFFESCQAKLIDSKTFQLEGIPVNTNQLQIQLSSGSNDSVYQIRLPGDAEFRETAGANGSFIIPTDGVSDMTIEMKPLKTVAVKIRVVDAQGEPVSKFLVFGAYSSNLENYEGGFYRTRDGAKRLFDDVATTYFSVEDGPNYGVMDTVFVAKNFDGDVYTQNGVVEGKEIVFFAITPDLRQGNARCVPTSESEVTIRLE